MKPKMPKWIIVVVAVVAVWLGYRYLRSDAPKDRPAAENLPNQRMVFRDGKWVRLDDREIQALMRDLASRTPGLVRVSGTVRNSESGSPVASAEVVFTNELGESSTAADEAGRYTIEIRPGFYRAFARADGYVAVGLAALQRLPGGPEVDMIGMPRGELAPLLGVFRDQLGVDMHLRGGAQISGTVYDTAGRPISGVVVMGRLSGFRGSQTRLVLGTDMDESDLDGSYHLEVPAGPVDLTAVHEDFAGLSEASTRSVYLVEGEKKRVDLTLTNGCIISGRVVDSEGQPVGDGSLEIWNRREPPNDYEPVGKIVAGKFRLARTEYGPLKLRAWPWRSPPTVPQEFSCSDGTRYDDVSFVVPDREPDLEGSVWSQTGEPLAAAFVDVFPLETGGMAQQERADIYGEWSFHSLPPGRYQLTAYVPGLGAAAQTVTVPSWGIKLNLSGTGSITGTVQGMKEGVFTFVMQSCRVRTKDGSVAQFDEFSMPHTTQLVPVEDGYFRIEGLPACPLSAVIKTPNRSETVRITIEADRSVPLSLDLRQAQPKTVYGVVMDGDRVPVAEVAVSRMAGPGSPKNHYAYTVSDDEGRYEIDVYTGDRLFFRSSAGWAEAQVSWSDAAREQLDVTLSGD